MSKFSGHCAGGRYGWNGCVHIGGLTRPLRNDLTVSHVDKRNMIAVVTVDLKEHKELAFKKLDEYSQFLSKVEIDYCLNIICG
jgi:hypothetical protein